MDPVDDREEQLLLSHHAAASPSLRYSAVHPVRLDGWLAKEGKSLRTRRNRYVRLVGHVLSSHRSKAVPPSWQVSVADAVVERGPHPREIRVLLPHRALSFVAPSHAAFDAWVVALRRAAIPSSRVDDYYRIGRLIGEGMNGQVRLAHDILTDDHVAIKMVPRLGRENETEFLARELQIILSVSHPNIVRTIDVFVRSRRIHFVMEYLAGGELFDFIAENTHFTEIHAAAVMNDLFQALFYLHSKGIAHRDVKLENLLCANKTWPLHVKLADFGFANYVNSGNEPMLSSFVGTPYYIAPEMLRGDPHGRPVDMWASGVVLYILLSGKFPFGGKNESEYYQRVLSKEAYFPSEEWSKVSEDAKNLVRGLLCKDPQKRLTAEQCLRHPWLKLGESVREPFETEFFPLDSDIPPVETLPSPSAFRDNQGKTGKWRHVGMLNHSLTRPTDSMIAARQTPEKNGRKESRPDSSSARLNRSGKANVHAAADGFDTSTVNRRPSLIRKLLSSGKLSLDRYDGRFPSFRGTVEDASDEASATPRKTLSLFSRDGPLRRSFHRVGDGRGGDDGINFVNSQSQRLPPKIARERQRQQRQAEAARRTSRAAGIFSNRKVAPEYSVQTNGYHSSPRLQTHLAHPFQKVPAPPGQRAPSNNQDLSSGMRRTSTPNRIPNRSSSRSSSNRTRIEEDVLRTPILSSPRREPDSPISSTDEDIVRRTVSADVTMSERQFFQSQLARADMFMGQGHAHHTADLIGGNSRHHAVPFRV